MKHICFNAYILNVCFPQNLNVVVIYSLSCSSKPIWLSFFQRPQIMVNIFLQWNAKRDGYVCIYIYILSWAVLGWKFHCGTEWLRIEQANRLAKAVRFTRTNQLLGRVSWLKYRIYHKNMMHFDILVLDSLWSPSPLAFHWRKNIFWNDMRVNKLLAYRILRELSAHEILSRSHH